MIEVILEELAETIAKLLLITLPLAILKNRYDRRKAGNVKKLSVLVGKGGCMDECEFPLPNDIICLGTDPRRCSIVYPRGTTNVEPLHCQLVPQQDGWSIVCFSDIGTWINGNLLDKGTVYPLRAGDKISVGSIENNLMVCGAEYSARADKTLADKFLRTDGRLDRKSCALRTLALAVATYSLYALIINMFRADSGLLMILVFAANGIISYRLMMRRLHDLDQPDFTAWFAALTPTIVLVLIMAAKRGTVGANQYGPDPSK